MHIVSKGLCTHCEFTTTTLLIFVPQLLWVTWVSLYHLCSRKSFLLQLIADYRFGCYQINLMNCFGNSQINLLTHMSKLLQLNVYEHVRIKVLAMLSHHLVSKPAWKTLLMKLIDLSVVRK